MIELIEVEKQFLGRSVLCGANLKVAAGESMVVIGGSGAGKSVILKHIIGLIQPDDGSVLVDGVDIAGLSTKKLANFRRRFGMLFQGAALFDSLPVWENVGFALKAHTTLSEWEIKKIVREKLSMVGLAGIEDRMPSDLSGGMKKRVGLARAIAMDPEIILYDEPTTGLDPIMADVINQLISKMNRQLSVTSVTITHDMKSAYQIADKIAMLYLGKILEVGPPDEIRNSANPIVQQFVTGSAVGPIPVGAEEERP
jgi:phospholipid/cholesterol/gamma-HCH transport system ATP-binding protein